MLADRYEIRQVLGEGAMSTVYLGYDHAEGAEVGIKSQPHGKTREHEMHAGIEHEHVVRLKNFIPGERRDYLVFERCDFSLISFINAHDIGMRASLKIMRMVLLGIKYLHDRGIIHRDIKLGNILIKGDTVKICDLGLACYASERDFSYCGTKDYLAPEIIKYWSNGGASCTGYDSKVDIYAAGVVFKILLGRRKDISVDEMDSVGEDVKGFLKDLLREEPAERPSAGQALKNRIFRQLIEEMPDFRMVKPFGKISKHGELKRDGNFVQIRWPSGAQASFHELRVEFEITGCNCLTPFHSVVYKNGQQVCKEHLTDSGLRYFNYLACYLRILCGKSPKLCIADGKATFTCFVDGSFIYERKSMKISGATGRNYYVVNGMREENLPRVYEQDVRRLQLACAERCKDCICAESREAEPGSTVGLTIGDQSVVRDSAFISGLGWCIRDHLRFQFLLNDGTRFVINAQRCTIAFGDRACGINKELPGEWRPLLKNARKFLLEFVK